MPRIYDVRAESNLTGEALTAAALALADGQLVIIPTDTVYGLAARPDVPGMRDRIYEAKARDHGKPIPLLAASISHVEAFGAQFGPIERRLAEVFWPGPLTLVLPVGDGHEGFRVPNHATTLRLLRAAGGLLLATSANNSGDPDALTAEQAVAALGNQVALVLDAGPAPGGKPSSVVRATPTGIEVLREGAVTREQLETASLGLP